MRHVTVCGGLNTYAGWPANHGAWQWGDEFLVGFMLGYFDKEGLLGNGIHAILPPYMKVQARSFDGGETWRVEDPLVDFVGRSPMPAPAFNLSESIIRVCGNYDTGGNDGVPPEGAFYLSRDRGITWEGPFTFTGLEQCWSERVYWNTSRTCVLGDRVFMSLARDQWGSDFVIEVHHNGTYFEMVNVVLQDRHRAVMPAAAMIGDSTFVAMRRKGHARNWIDLCVQMHPGQEWMHSGLVMDTGSHNGNPPALVAVGDALYCAAGDRSNKVINVAVSRNFGGEWKLRDVVVLRSSLTVDIGYPRLFTRSDGKLVCVYYYADAPGQAQRIEATIFDP